MVFQTSATELAGRLARWFSPGGPAAGHQVLLFHRILAEPDHLLPDDPDVQLFEALLRFLQRHFTILPLSEALSLLEKGRLPRASLSITFDDGYRDNATLAVPVLQSLDLSATFFIASGYLDGGRMWNDSLIEAVRLWPGEEMNLNHIGLGRHRLGNLDRRHDVAQTLIRQCKYLPEGERADKVAAVAGQVEGLPDDLMMSTDQLKQLAAAGMEVGGHTRSHPILTRLSVEQAREELAAGRDDLEGILGEKVALFAYPNGRLGQDYEQVHADLARELGFRAAFSTNPGVTRADSDPWQLPRFTPWDKGHGRFALRLLRNRLGWL